MSSLTGSADHEEQARPASERLVSAAADVIAANGLAFLSARTVAASASVAPSAVNYNFGGIDDLASAAFEWASGETDRLLVLAGQELNDLPHGPDGFCAALEHVLDLWTLGPARRLAFLYQERQLAAPYHGGLAQRWTHRWRNFFVAVAARFGLPERSGALAHAFFESEGLYGLSRWSPALERMAGRELLDAFGATWLGATPSPPRGALVHIERMLKAISPPTLTDAAARIADAALDVVEHGGLSALTHRAVATKAGVTAGAVAYHFRTAPDLVSAALHAQHRRAVAPASACDEDEPPSAVTDLHGLVRDALPLDAAPTPLAMRRALFLAAVRRTDLAPAAARIRFSHGGRSARLLRAAPERPAVAAVCSRLVSALWSATLFEEEPAAARERLLAEILAPFG